MNYYDHTANLSEELFEIHEYCWDDTGRPKHKNSLNIALGKLCEISNDWQEFSNNCDEFFFAEVDNYLIALAWHCYVKGLVVLSKKLEKM